MGQKLTRRQFMLRSVDFGWSGKYIVRVLINHVI
jgi:hypothetical protein